MNISLGGRDFPLQSVGLSVPGVQTPVVVRPGTSDEPAFIQVFVEQQYNFDFSSFSPRLCIDGGANVGYASLWFKNLFPSCRIIAVEPEETNCDQFEHNLRGYQDVKLVRGALWHRSGPGSLIREEQGALLEHWAFKVTQSDQAAANSVRLHSIPDLLGAEPQLDLLKLDIEGAEEDLFMNGSEAWLHKVQVLILEFHEQMRPGSAARIVERLSRFEWNVSERGEHVMFRRV